MYRKRIRKPAKNLHCGPLDVRVCKFKKIENVTQKIVVVATQGGRKIIEEKEEVEIKDNKKNKLQEEKEKMAKIMVEYFERIVQAEERRKEERRKQIQRKTIVIKYGDQLI